MFDLFDGYPGEITLEAEVEPHFLDSMGHMNTSWYTRLFDRAVWEYFARVGLDDSYFRLQNRGSFALEETTRYLAEVRGGEHLAVQTGLVEVHDKTVRLAQVMVARERAKRSAVRGGVAAHIDLTTRRSAPFPSDLSARLKAEVVPSLNEGVLTEAGAQAFARRWIEHWNRLDVEAVLAHYADDAVFVSPRAEHITGHAVVTGKAALGAYWRQAVQKHLHLEFTLEAASFSPRAETLTILYRSVIGDAPAQRAVEIMRFRGSRIVRGEALYGAVDQLPTLAA